MNRWYFQRLSSSGSRPSGGVCLMSVGLRSRSIRMVASRAASERVA